MSVANKQRILASFNDENVTLQLRCLQNTPPAESGRVELPLDYFTITNYY